MPFDKIPYLVLSLPPEKRASMMPSSAASGRITPLAVVNTMTGGPAGAQTQGSQAKPIETGAAPLTPQSTFAEKSMGMSAGQMEQQQSMQEQSQQMAQQEQQLQESQMAQQEQAMKNQEAQMKMKMDSMKDKMELAKLQSQAGQDSGGSAGLKVHELMMKDLHKQTAALTKNIDKVQMQTAQLPMSLKLAMVGGGLFKSANQPAATPPMPKPVMPKPVMPTPQVPTTPAPAKIPGTMMNAPKATFEPVGVKPLDDMQFQLSRPMGPNDISAIKSYPGGPAAYFQNQADAATAATDRWRTNPILSLWNDATGDISQNIAEDKARAEAAAAAIPEEDRFRFKNLMSGVPALWHGVKQWGWDRVFRPWTSNTAALSDAMGRTKDDYQAGGLGNVDVGNVGSVAANLAGSLPSPAVGAVNTAMSYMGNEADDQRALSDEATKYLELTPAQAGDAARGGEETSADYGWLASLLGNLLGGAAQRQSAYVDPAVAAAYNRYQPIN